MTRVAERIWMIFAGVFLATAAVLLWRNDLTAAFVTATLGVAAWFLSFRSQVRARNRAEEEAEPIDEGDEE